MGKRQPIDKDNPVAHISEACHTGIGDEQLKEKKRKRKKLYVETLCKFNHGKDSFTQIIERTLIVYNLLTRTTRKT